MNLRAWWRGRKRKWPWITGGVVLLLLVISAISGDPRRMGPEGVSSAVPRASTSTTTMSVAAATIPNDLVGKSPKDARPALEALGFRNIAVESVDGRSVIVEANWRVVSIDGIGTSVPLSTRVVLRVEKPQPATTTTVEPTATPEPAPVPQPQPVPEPQPEPPAPRDAYYANCDEARRAGAAPLYAGQPGYRRALDRDGDGIACDK